MITKNLVFSLVAILGTHISMSWAALAPPSASTAPQKILSRAGEVTGGVAGKGFSIKNMALTSSGSKERIIIDMGDINGGDLKDYPGYYHAELQQNPRRLIIDFAQTPNIEMDEKTINQKLKASNRISHSSVLIDPTDQTLSLILDLKKSTQVQVFQVKGSKSTGRVVVDLME